MTQSPTERILALAAYLDRHRSDDVTLSDVSRDVPGYDDGDAPRDADGRLLAGTPEWSRIRKMVRRDLDDLRDQWDIDVVYDEATHTYRLPPPFFTAHERAALISAAAVVSVEGLPPTEPGAIGAGVDDGTARVVVQVHALVTVLRDAIGTRTPVRFRHEGRTRVLEPWALGVWRNRWYVAGGDPEHDGAMRRFRLDRIQVPAGHAGSQALGTDDAPATAIEMAGEPGSYEIPEWFDVERAFDFDPNSWGSDPPLDVQVRVARDHLGAFTNEFGGTVLESSESSGGDAIVGITVRHYESFRNRVLGFRGHAVVVAPDEMVDMVRTHLAAVAGTVDHHEGR